jgi:hypothetical protein
MRIWIDGVPCAFENVFKKGWGRIYENPRSLARLSCRAMLCPDSSSRRDTSRPASSLKEFLIYIATAKRWPAHLGLLRSELCRGEH